MKKAAISLILVLTFAMPGSAAKLKFGPMGGLSLCFGDNNGTLGSDPSNNRYSLKLGIAFSYSLSRSISILPEICWSRKGPDVGHGRGSFMTAHFDYLEISAPATRHLEGLPVDIYAGPYLAYLIKASPLIQYPLHSDGVASQEKLSNWDMGVSFGIRFTDKDGFFVEIQENFGLINVLREDPDPDPHFRNSVLSLNAGILFNW